MAIFLPKILPQKMAKLLTLLFFTLFLLKLCFFFQKSHSPCRKKKIFEKQLNTTKKIEKKMAKLLTLHDQIINSTAYMYIWLMTDLLPTFWLQKWHWPPQTTKKRPFMGSKILGPNFGPTSFETKKDRDCRNTLFCVSPSQKHYDNRGFRTPVFSPSLITLKKPIAR